MGSAKKFEIAIIGSGTAGMTAYNAASKCTNNLVMIEGGSYGTTCARVGCMPSKLLLTAANHAYAIDRGEVFGVRAPNVIVDGQAVMSRVRAERDRFVGSVLSAIERVPQARKMRGETRFLSPHRLLVGDEEIEAERIVIATGSSPKVPGFLQSLGDRLLTNENLFELRDLPDTVAVFGPGVLGLELGQALARLGVDIRMFGVGGSLASIGDSEIREYAERCFNREFYLDTDAGVDSVQAVGEGVEITYEHREKGRVTEHFEYVLAATGRAPNLEALDLETSGLTLNDQGMPQTNRETLQCENSHIFLAGDANNNVPFLHEAADEGRIAGSNAAAYPDVCPVQRKVPFSVVFTSPQFAALGDTPQERAGLAGGSYELKAQGRARINAENHGIIKVYGEPGSGLFLGAEVLGPEAEHIGHLLAWAAQQRMTVPEMLKMPFYHPVIEEGVRSALRDLQYRLELGPEMTDHCMECGPGD